MNKKIDDIIKELIAIDPSFAEHEEKLRTLIAELLTIKPDSKLDPEFVARLRSRLLQEPQPSPFNAALYLPYGVLAVLAFVLVVPLGYYMTQQNSGAPVFAMNQEIQHLGNDAYGSIAQQAEGLGGGKGAVETSASVPLATAMTAQSDPSTAPAESAKLSASMAYGSGGGATDARMMLPQGPITVVSYTYKGDPLELAGNGDVYSRVKSSISSAQVAGQLKKFNFGLVNLGSFADMRLRSFELAEDKPYGYTISASFDDGMISINPNYTQWPGLNGKEIAQQLPVSAMLKDEEIIAIAKKFLDDHDISIANFGEPTIQGAMTELAADSQPQYAPEQVTVTYPLKISGTEVFEDGAYPYGLQVGVSIRDKKVMSVYGLTSQTYSSSGYSLETSADKVLAAVQKGGAHAWVPQESEGIQVKKVEAEVGTPTKVLMHTYNYKDGTSQELFVPALSFPVTKAAEGEQYYTKQIVIPLVPDLLVDQGGPVIYDMMR